MALIFLVTAKDGSGAELTVLPDEVHVHTEYVDGDVGREDDQNVTLYWLDPADNQWKPAPKVATDPASNVVEASIMNLGNYVVMIP